MKGKMKAISKLAPLALVIAMICTPFASAATSGDLDTAEGTILAAAVLFFLVAIAAIFWVLPQKKEKKLVPGVIGMAVAIAIVAVAFYFTSFLTGYNIAFWTEWLDWTSYSGTILIGIAGAFLVLLFTAYAAYNEKNDKKERDIVVLGFLAATIWSILVLLPAFIGFGV